MKLISYLHGGRESWGAVTGNAVIDLQEPTGIASLAEFLGSGQFIARDSLAAAAKITAEFDSIKLLPPIPRPEKIICAVRNYLDHHQEIVASGIKRELSDFPPIFLRTWRSQVAHREPIVRPRVSETLDWEGEMAIVIGKGGRNITEGVAYEHVAGYSVYNDASVRDWQFHAKQITSGKNFESTGGFGPWVVTRDEITDGASLNLTTRVNGGVVQSGNTNQMIFSTAQLIAYASTIFTLVPGDVVVTGTPSGVGFSRKPPQYLKQGDIVEVELERIGTLRNPVVDQVW